MLFPTMTFALFFVVVLGVSWKLNDRPVQWKLFVLASSYLFYGWADWKFCFLLAGSTVGNWLVAMALAPGTATAPGAPGWRSGSSGNLALLGFFKYYGFFIDSVLAALQPLGLAPTALLVQIALPVGISFFTFCAISYVIDVYRDEQEPVALLDFAVYLSFFPHLVAGPIVRVSEFEPQLRRRRNPDTIDATRAARLICRGLFKKVVIANYLATAIVDPVFVAPSTAHATGSCSSGRGPTRCRSTRTSPGYTDIAIGIALLMGIKFPDNFDQPYSVAVDPGVLAPLAHDAVALAARLPVHPAGRQPGWPEGGVPQPVPDDAAGRAVARRQLELRHLGRVPRLWSRGGAVARHA